MRLCNTVVFKKKGIAYSECVFVTLVDQNWKRMRHILSSVASPALQHFSVLSHKRHDFRGGEGSYWTQNVCFDFLCNYCLKYFSF